MAREIFCDKCGKKCTAEHFTIKATRDDGPVSENELCRSCWHTFVFSWKKSKR
jgi:hypothetical protein